MALLLLAPLLAIAAEIEVLSAWTPARHVVPTRLQWRLWNKCMRFLAPPIVTLAILAALAAMPASATLNMNAGLWETTVTADGQAHSASAKCYTRTDIAEMERLLRGKSSRVDGICRYADFTQSGDSVNYTMTCRLGDDEQTSA